MHVLHGHLRYFKFKREYQQYGQCFQIIFLFLMTMVEQDVKLITYVRWCPVLQIFQGEHPPMQDRWIKTLAVLYEGILSL